MVANGDWTYKYVRMPCNIAVMRPPSADDGVPYASPMMGGGGITIGAAAETGSTTGGETMTVGRGAVGFGIIGGGEYVGRLWMVWMVVGVVGGVGVVGVVGVGVVMGGDSSSKDTSNAGNWKNPA